MKMLTPFVASVLLFLCVSLINAQTERVAEATKRIPLEARAEQDFVPKGWEMHGKAQGDLNGDGLSDAVITLTLPYEVADKLKEKEGDKYTGAPNIVVVLMGKNGGGFTRFALNGQLFPESGDARSYMTPTIKNGVLILNNNWGDVYAIDITYRFRYDSQVGKLMLIGFDQELYNRADNFGMGSKSSENYLTGVEIDYEKKRSGSYVETRRKTIPRAKVTFEQTRVYDNGDIESIRPF